MLDFWWVLKGLVCLRKYVVDNVARIKVVTFQVIEPGELLAIF